MKMLLEISDIMLPYSRYFDHFLKPEQHCDLVSVAQGALQHQLNPRRVHLRLDFRNRGGKVLVSVGSSDVQVAQIQIK